MDRKLKVLIVDDEPIVLKSIKMHLARDNFEIVTVLQAEDALKELKLKNVDIVLTDLMMPEMDGLEFMAAMKKQKSNAQIIMITGYATISTAIEAKKLGAFDYITKPFTKKELRETVLRLAEIIIATLDSQSNTSSEETLGNQGQKIVSDRFRIVGDNTWLVREENENVLIGVERPFLISLGRIKSVFLPKVGDNLRQGSSAIQFISFDLKSLELLSPLSGTVVEVNEVVLSNPNTVLQYPYGEGWLLRIKPSRFEEEIKVIGL
ncbi:MAG: response regulator [Calditrichaeota bacterium]|nr:response regulator [Calditrichota bacterium]MBT7788194.1 response regulator [Calditrichota bacterium]